MTRSHPSRTLYLVLAALLVLLPLLAVLQYRWIGEVSQAERRQLEDHLNQSGFQFADDLTRELFRILVAFQVRGQMDSPDLADTLAQRYDDSAALYPNLVRHVFLVRRTDSGVDLTQLDPEIRTFRPADWPAEFESLREGLSGRIDRFNRPRTWWESANGNPLIPMPILSDRALQFHGRFPRPGEKPDHMPPPPSKFFGWALIELNRKVLLDDVIPTLVTRHFATGPTAEHRVAIIERGTPGTPPQVLYRSDASFSVDDMKTPDLRLMLFRPDLGRSRPGGPSPEFPPKGVPGMRMGMFLPGSWELLVQHRAGSLDSQVAALRHRDLTVSFGILLLLAASVVLVVLSSHRARALAHLRMDFVARVSHELRTPLAIIRSAAYNVANGVVSDEKEVREYASMIQTEGQRLSTMVDQILSFSRTETGRESYDIQPLRVDEVIDHATQTMSGSVRTAGCEITHTIAANLPRVKADERALVECLQNLLANALKYGTSGGVARIEVDARRADPNTVVVTVADNGPGIDAADLPHIFEPFYRGKNARSDTPGSGLGLDLVRRMMQAQGGSVTVESEPGRGARFTLHLTAVPEAVS